MALSINATEADELARSLARVTGETLTDAVTVALCERLTRARARRDNSDLSTRLTVLSARLRAAYGTSPVTRAEWDAASGDEG